MGAGASGDAPLDVDDDDPDALSPKNGSMFCGGEDGTLSLFYDPGPARPAVEKGVVVEAAPGELDVDNFEAAAVVGGGVEVVAGLEDDDAETDPAALGREIARARAGGAARLTHPLHETAEVVSDLEDDDDAAEPPAPPADGSPKRKANPVFEDFAAAASDAAGAGLGGGADALRESYDLAAQAAAATDAAARDAAEQLREAADEADRHVPDAVRDPVDDLRRRVDVGVAYAGNADLRAEDAAAVAGDLADAVEAAVAGAADDVARAVLGEDDEDEAFDASVYHTYDPPREDDLPASPTVLLAPAFADEYSASEREALDATVLSERPPPDVAHLKRRRLKSLKVMLTKNGVDFRGCVERFELEELCAQHGLGKEAEAADEAPAPTDEETKDAVADFDDAPDDPPDDPPEPEDRRPRAAKPVRFSQIEVETYEESAAAADAKPPKKKKVWGVRRAARKLLGGRRVRGASREPKPREPERPPPKQGVVVSPPPPAPAPAPPCAELVVYQSPGDLAKKLQGMGPAFAPIANRVVEMHVDSTFLESLDKAAALETLEDLGAKDRLVKRRVAHELNLAL